MKKSMIGGTKVKSRLLPLCLFAIALLSINSYAAIVDMGSASSFGILASSAITNNGSVSIDGDIGISPNTASSITGFPPGFYTGTMYAGDGVSLQARNDAVAAYNGLAGMAVSQDLTGQDLGGLTLTSGVYKFSSSAQITGGLTLDAQNDPEAYFVFQIGSTLTTASTAGVIILNAPATFSNVYWQVGSSATLGIGTTFVGSILADQSISFGGGTLYGAAIALNGAVTIAGQQSIIVPEPATIAMLIFGTGFVTRKLRKTR